MEMTDTRPIESSPQAAIKPDSLSPSSTVSSEASQSSNASFSKPRHRRFLSLDGLESTSTRLLTRIRSRSPRPRASSPSGDRQRRRSPSPLSPDLATGPQSASPASPLSPSSVDRIYSPSDMSPTSSPYPQRPGIGHARFSDATTSTMESPDRVRSDSYKRYSGTINHYGRHSNDWLFGGFSVRDTLKDGIEKLKGYGERDN